MSSQDGPPFNGAPLVGQRLLSVEKKNYTWLFVFSADVSIATESAWRVIERHRIVVGSEDHDQRFGRPSPVNAGNEVLTRAQGGIVEAVSVAADTGDLTISFSTTTYLQLLQLSSGYESWRLVANGQQTVCTGGGSIATDR